MRPIPICLLGLGLAACATQPRAPAVASATGNDGWSDDYLTRLKAQALLQGFNADLLSHPSATATLERWCGAHHLAVEAKISARQLHDIDKPASADIRAALQVDAAEPINYRRVQLWCGEHMLSEADNWYVPARLSAAMNQTLEHTDTPFGRAVKALDFRRETVAATLLWVPLPEAWELQPASLASSRQRLAIPTQVLQHRAILYRHDNLPFSEVVETYGADIFAFALTPASTPGPGTPAR